MSRYTCRDGLRCTTRGCTYMHMRGENKRDLCLVEFLRRECLSKWCNEIHRRDNVPYNERIRMVENYTFERENLHNTRTTTPKKITLKRGKYEIKKSVGDLINRAKSNVLASKTLIYEHPQYTIREDDEHPSTDEIQQWVLMRNAMCDESKNEVEKKRKLNVVKAKREKLIRVVNANMNMIKLNPFTCNPESSVPPAKKWQPIAHEDIEMPSTDEIQQWVKKRRIK